MYPQFTRFCEERFLQNCKLACRGGPSPVVLFYEATDYLVSHAELEHQYFPGSSNYVFANFILRQKPLYFRRQSRVEHYNLFLVCPFLTPIKTTDIFALVLCNLSFASRRLYLFRCFVLLKRERFMGSANGRTSIWTTFPNKCVLKIVNMVFLGPMHVTFCSYYMQHVCFKNLKGAHLFSCKAQLLRIVNISAC